LRTSSGVAKRALLVESKQLFDVAELEIQAQGLAGSAHQSPLQGETHIDHCARVQFSRRSASLPDSRKNRCHLSGPKILLGARDLRGIG
jgi:hypothetical protein